MQEANISNWKDRNFSHLYTHQHFLCPPIIFWSIVFSFLFPSLEMFQGWKLLWTGWERLTELLPCWMARSMRTFTHPTKALKMFTFFITTSSHFYCFSVNHMQIWKPGFLKRKVPDFQLTLMRFTWVQLPRFMLFSQINTVNIWKKSLFLLAHIS